MAVTEKQRKQLVFEIAAVERSFKEVSEAKSSSRLAYDSAMSERSHRLAGMRIGFETMGGEWYEFRTIEMIAERAVWGDRTPVVFDEVEA